MSFQRIVRQIEVEAIEAQFEKNPVEFQCAQEDQESQSIDSEIERIIAEVEVEVMEDPLPIKEAIQEAKEVAPHNPIVYLIDEMICQEVIDQCGQMMITEKQIEVAEPQQQKEAVVAEDSDDEDKPKKNPLLNLLNKKISKKDKMAKVRQAKKEKVSQKDATLTNDESRVKLVANKKNQALQIKSVADNMFKTWNNDQAVADLYENQEAWDKESNNFFKDEGISMKVVNAFNKYQEFKETLSEEIHTNVDKLIKESNKVKSDDMDSEEISKQQSFCCFQVPLPSSTIEQPSTLFQDYRFIECTCRGATSNYGQSLSGVRDSLIRRFQLFFEEEELCGQCFGIKMTRWLTLMMIYYQLKIQNNLKIKKTISQYKQRLQSQGPNELFIVEDIDEWRQRRQRKQQQQQQKFQSLTEFLEMKSDLTLDKYCFAFESFKLLEDINKDFLLKKSSTVATLIKDKTYFTYIELAIETCNLDKFYNEVLFLLQSQFLLSFRVVLREFFIITLPSSKSENIVYLMSKTLIPFKFPIILLNASWVSAKHQITKFSQQSLQFKEMFNQCFAKSMMEFKRKFDMDHCYYFNKSFQNIFNRKRHYGKDDQITIDRLHKEFLPDPLVNNQLKDNTTKANSYESEGKTNETFYISYQENNWRKSYLMEGHMQARMVAKQFKQIGTDFGVRCIPSWFQLLTLQVLFLNMQVITNCLNNSESFNLYEVHMGYLFDQITFFLNVYWYNVIRLVNKKNSYNEFLERVGKNVNGAGYFLDHKLKLDMISFIFFYFYNNGIGIIFEEDSNLMDNHFEEYLDDQNDSGLSSRKRVQRFYTILECLEIKNWYSCRILIQVLKKDESLTKLKKRSFKVNILDWMDRIRCQVIKAQYTVFEPICYYLKRQFEVTVDKKIIFNEVTYQTEELQNEKNKLALKRLPQFDSLVRFPKLFHSLILKDKLRLKDYYQVIKDQVKTMLQQKEVTEGVIQLSNRMIEAKNIQLQIQGLDTKENLMMDMDNENNQVQVYESKEFLMSKYIYNQLKLQNLDDGNDIVVWNQKQLISEEFNFFIQHIRIQELLQVVDFSTDTMTIPFIMSITKKMTENRMAEIQIEKKKLNMIDLSSQKGQFKMVKEVFSLDNSNNSVSYVQQSLMKTKKEIDQICSFFKQKFIFGDRLKVDQSKSDLVDIAGQMKLLQQFISCFQLESSVIKQMGQIFNVQSQWSNRQQLLAMNPLLDAIVNSFKSILQRQKQQNSINQNSNNLKEIGFFMSKSQKNKLLREMPDDEFKMRAQKEIWQKKQDKYVHQRMFLKSERPQVSIQFADLKTSFCLIAPNGFFQNPKIEFEDELTGQKMLIEKNFAKCEEVMVQIRKVNYIYYNIAKVCQLSNVEGGLQDIMINDFILMILNDFLQLNISQNKDYLLGKQYVQKKQSNQQEIELEEGEMAFEEDSEIMIEEKKQTSKPVFASFLDFWMSMKAIFLQAFMNNIVWKNVVKVEEDQFILRDNKQFFWLTWAFISKGLLDNRMLNFIGRKFNILEWIKFIKQRNMFLVKNQQVFPQLNRAYINIDKLETELICLEKVFEQMDKKQKEDCDFVWVMIQYVYGLKYFDGKEKHNFNAERKIFRTMTLDICMIMVKSLECQVQQKMVSEDNVLKEIVFYWYSLNNMYKFNDFMEDFVEEYFNLVEVWLLKVMQIKMYYFDKLNIKQSISLEELEKGCSKIMENIRARNELIYEDSEIYVGWEKYYCDYTKDYQRISESLQVIYQKKYFRKDVKAMEDNYYASIRSQLLMLIQELGYFTNLKDYLLVLVDLPFRRYKEGIQNLVSKIFEWMADGCEMSRIQEIIGLAQSCIYWVQRFSANQTEQENKMLVQEEMVRNQYQIEKSKKYQDLYKFEDLKYPRVIQQIDVEKNEEQVLEIMQSMFQKEFFKKQMFFQNYQLAKNGQMKKRFDIESKVKIQNHNVNQNEFMSLGNADQFEFTFQSQNNVNNTTSNTLRQQQQPNQENQNLFRNKTLQDLYCQENEEAEEGEVVNSDESAPFKQESQTKQKEEEEKKKKEEEKKKSTTEGVRNRCGPLSGVAKKIFK